MSAESNPAQSTTESNDSLQFDRAEFNQSAAFPCAFCKTPIAGDYFQVNGQTSCPNCREQLNSAMSGGSKSLRALRALAAGHGGRGPGPLVSAVVKQGAAFTGRKLPVTIVPGELTEKEIEDLA